MEGLGGSAFELGIHGGDVVVENEKLKGATVGGVGGVQDVVEDTHGVVARGFRHHEESDAEGGVGFGIVRGDVVGDGVAASAQAS